MTPSQAQDLIDELEKANAKLDEVHKTLNALLGFAFIAVLLFAIFK